MCASPAAQTFKQLWTEVAERSAGLRAASVWEHVESDALGLCDKKAFLSRDLQ